jgi:uncharacterized membrane protein YfcA
MEFLPVIIVAFGASLLTFFSGFGLGTLLTPVFLFFFPPEIAIAATATVHFLNNLFKLGLIGRFMSLKVVLKFGLPAIFGAYAGAWLLTQLSLFQTSIVLAGIETNALNVVLGLLILVFALFELIPSLRDMELSTKLLIPGGVLSGFFGGLSGHQGALRAAFLVKLGMSKEAFVATGVVIACMVDIIRLGTYAQAFPKDDLIALAPLLSAATLAAFAGALVGKKLLKKTTFQTVQNIVGIFMLIVAILLILGSI